MTVKDEVGDGAECAEVADRAHPRSPSRTAQPPVLDGHATTYACGCWGGLVFNPPRLPCGEHGWRCYSVNEYIGHIKPFEITSQGGKLMKSEIFFRWALCRERFNNID